MVFHRAITKIDKHPAQLYFLFLIILTNRQTYVIILKKNIFFIKVLLTSVMPERFLSNLVECRHFRIRCLHAQKEILAKCAIILTSKLKFSDKTLRILGINNRFVK